MFCARLVKGKLHLPKLRSVWRLVRGVVVKIDIEIALCPLALSYEHLPGTITKLYGSRFLGLGLRFRVPDDRKCVKGYLLECLNFVL